MRAEYDLVPEDWGVFAEHCASRSQSFHRGKLWVQAGGAFALVVAVYRFVPGYGSWTLLISTLLVGAGWWAAPRLMYRSIRRQALARERPCLRGRHILEADTDGLHAKCDVTESLHSWAGIRSVESRGEHVFVFIGDSLGYAVPRARTVSGDVDRFVQVARGRARVDA